MSFMKINPNGSTTLAVLKLGKSKQTKNKNKHSPNGAYPFYRCCYCSVLTQAAWYNRGPAVNGIEYAQHSTALETATDRTRPLSCSLVMIMECICCFSHGICIEKCVFGYSIPTGKYWILKSGKCSFLSVSEWHKLHIFYKSK